MRNIAIALTLILTLSILTVAQVLPEKREPKPVTVKMEQVGSRRVGRWKRLLRIVFYTLLDESRPRY